jgi:hypothetical protein
MSSAPLALALLSSLQKDPPHSQTALPNSLFPAQISKFDKHLQRVSQSSAFRFGALSFSHVHHIRQVAPLLWQGPGDVVVEKLPAASDGRSQGSENEGVVSSLTYDSLSNNIRYQRVRSFPRCGLIFWLPLSNQGQESGFQENSHSERIGPNEAFLDLTLIPPTHM